MFFHFPAHITAELRHLALILNTVTLIIILVIMEFIYSDTAKQERRQLKVFIPLFLVLAGLLVVAGFVQNKGL